MLSDHLFQQVRKATRQKGVAYFVRDRVRITTGSTIEVKAHVRGRADYDVHLLFADESLRIFCTCPYFESTLGPCKHVWATLLAAERAGHLEAAAGRRDLRFKVDDSVMKELTSKPAANRSAPAPRHPIGPTWKKTIQQLARDGEMQRHQETPSRRPPWSGERQILFIIDASASMAHGQLVVEVPHRERKKDGEWSKPKMQALRIEDLTRLGDSADMQIASLLMNCNDQYGAYYGERTLSRKVLAPELYDAVLPAMCATGRCYLTASTSDYGRLEPLEGYDVEPWQFTLDWKLAPASDSLILSGMIARGEEHVPLSSLRILLASGLAIVGNRFARVDFGGAHEWTRVFRSQPEMIVPLREKEQFLAELFKLKRLPFLHLPPELEVTEISASPRHKLLVRQNRSSYPGSRLEAELVHRYEDEEVAFPRSGGMLYLPQRRVLVRRDLTLEDRARERLLELGLRWRSDYYSKCWEFSSAKLPKIIRALVSEGWLVEAEGKLYRTPGEFKIDVTTGIDWFGLDARVDFEGQSIPLPKLLHALKKGDGIVQLGDGSYGMLPEDWLKKYGIFANIGTIEGDQIRFAKTQVGVLDALLATQENARTDDAFRQARDRFHSFEGIAAANPPKKFQGELRGYQREGLGWLMFLQEFGWGGCLADDMGLGKTVQVLALLGQRALQRSKTPRASLVVVPRSLIFNWQAEAARFAPWLKVLDHSGAGRAKDAAAFKDFDLVLTTYGLLRRDALLFKDCRFDYCILDESQAIKNASTEQAKAVRLLQANHRLAMSGTPVENHLGELWSLFEFLNPGMLGQASVFKMTGSGGRNPDPQTRELLAKALRPFILRRTKAQVAKDLPEKTEQTVFCDMEPDQRRQYDELRDYYRASLLSKIETDGVNKSKILVLEALLRLRQAACHPGLIDKRKAKDGSAKLDILLPRLEEVFEEGHKAIVFSQFTSLLDIVKRRLDIDKIPYEYLDGKTRNRQERVERFQTDPECKLFLISLKAGGVGLNLTAAEYVFLLDPWWNPAVEAQAIDRTHRIGQTRPVFAYRIIARDTVEEKVLELQKNKRALADAILNADNSLISGLKKEDIELLLS